MPLPQTIKSLIDGNFITASFFENLTGEQRSLIERHAENIIRGSITVRNALPGTSLTSDTEFQLSLSEYCIHLGNTMKKLLNETENLVQITNPIERSRRFWEIATEFAIRCRFTFIQPWVLNTQTALFHTMVASAKSGEDFYTLTRSLNKVPEWVCSKENEHEFLEKSANLGYPLGLLSIYLINLNDKLNDNHNTEKERANIETMHKLINSMDGKDPTTLRTFEDVLATLDESFTTDERAILAEVIIDLFKGYKTDINEPVDSKSKKSTEDKIPQSISGSITFSSSFFSPSTRSEDPCIEDNRPTNKGNSLRGPGQHRT